MKKSALAAALILSLFTSPGISGTLEIPKRKPACTVKVPDSWEPEDTDKGYAIESPDKVATVFLEVTSKKGIDDLLSENIDWLTEDQGVKMDAASKKEQDFELAGRKWSRISWDGKSKEWGPAVIGFLFTEVAKGKLLTVTYWITKKDADKHMPTLEKIFSSVKAVEE